MNKTSTAILLTLSLATLTTACKKTRELPDPFPVYQESEPEPEDTVPARRDTVEKVEEPVPEEHYVEEGTASTYSRSAYDWGYDEGYEAGHKDGYDNRKGRSYDNTTNDYEDDEAEEWMEGYDEGYNRGFQKGRDKGIFDRSVDPGFYNQYEKGFDGEYYDPALDGWD